MAGMLGQRLKIEKAQQYVGKDWHIYKLCHKSLPRQFEFEEG